MDATLVNARLPQLGLLVGMLLMFGLTSCAGMDDQQQKIISGGVIGAVVGTVGIAVTGGCIPCGTVIGGVVGAGAGYLIDQIEKNTRSSPSTTSSSPAPSQGYQSSGYQGSGYQGSGYQGSGNQGSGGGGY